MSLGVSDVPTGPDPVRIPPLRWLARGLWRGLVVPVLLLWSLGTVVAVILGNSHRLFFDFRGGMYNAGLAMRHGHDPYRAAYVAHQAAVMRGGGIAVGETAKHVFSVPLYPAFANLAMVPLSALPFTVAAISYTLVSIAAMFGALRLLGVRDWRCHALVLISWPFLFGVVLGAIGPFLVIGAALAWRWRDRVLLPALAVGGIVALKIFPWTLGVWLLMTRRWRALAMSIGVAALLTFGAWALIGFHGLAAYPRMLSDATFIQEGRADSLATVLLVGGASPRVAQGAALLVGIALLGLAARLVGRSDGDRRAFGLAVLACLVGTPIVWDHYMVLLFVPIALLSPRLSRLWALPVIMPSLITLSDLAFPAVSRPQAYPLSALNSAVGWLLAEALLITLLATTAQQRAAWAAALRSPRTAAVRWGQAPSAPPA